MTETVPDFKQLRRSHAKELHAASLTHNSEAQKYIHKIEALNRRIDYYRNALTMIAEPPPMEALYKPSWQEMGRILSARMKIATQALRGERIERESPAVAGPASGEVLDADREREPQT